MLYAVAAFSAFATLIHHLWVMPEHFQEWWGYGAFFLVASCAQLLYVPLLLLRPTQNKDILMRLEDAEKSQRVTV